MDGTLDFELGEALTMARSARPNILIRSGLSQRFAIEYFEDEAAAMI